MKPLQNFAPLYFLTLVSLLQVSDSLTISLLPNETLTETNNSSGILESASLHEGDNSTTTPAERSTVTTPKNPQNKTDDPETFTPTPGVGVQKLAQVINDTILSINELIISSMRNVSQAGQHDFQKVGALLQNMQNFLSARGTIISQDAETNLERELRGIQTFIGEHQNQFRNLSNSQKNVTRSPIHILQVGLDPGDNHTLDPNTTQGHGRISSNSRTAKGGPQSGMVNNIMQFSTKVGEGLRSTIEGAENIVTNSVNQIQNQIQNFLNGITNFFTKNSGGSDYSPLSTKRFFNLSRNGLQQPPPRPLMFRRQEVISQ